MFESVFTAKELAEILGVKICCIRASAKKLGYKSNQYTLEEAKSIKAYLLHPKHPEKKQVFYRVSIRDFDGKRYVKHAGLTKKEAGKIVELYRQQYLKAVAIPCNSNRRNRNG